MDRAVPQWSRVCPLSGFRRSAHARNIRELRSGETEASARAGPYPVFLLVSLAIMVLAFANTVRRSKGCDIEHAGAGWPAVLLVVAGILVDVVFIEHPGFILAGTGLFWTTAHAFDKAHPLRDAGWAAGLSIATYLLFAKLLELQLPAGLLLALAVVALTAERDEHSAAAASSRTAEVSSNSR
jgi:putative tricarboxylic transport membrane protein